MNEKEYALFCLQEYYRIYPINEKNNLIPRFFLDVDLKEWRFLTGLKLTGMSREEVFKNGYKLLLKNKD